MDLEKQDKETLLAEIEALKAQLFDANNIIDAIRDGAVDALVVHDAGVPQIYSLESADYTYRILIEKFSEGALSIAEDGLILYCNDYFSGLAGLPAEKITGNYIQLYFESGHDYDELLASMDGGSSKKEIMLNIYGSKLPVYMSFTNLFPTVHAIGVVVTDLSEKKRHEEALVNYQKELELKVNELNVTNTNLEQFIHVISHDLKEPLRKMLMYTSRIAVAGSEQDVNSLGVIKSSAQRLNSLVDDLVKYAFISVKDDSADVNLNEVLKEVTDDLELMINDYGAIITSDTLPTISGTRVQMRQLFSNLITNAIKYSKEGESPEIAIQYYQVTYTDDSRFHKITIQDNGIGMDKAYLNKIFTIFQRLHMPNEYSGNGIGLAICKKIMENHSGSIEVHSILNNGSTFELYFPVTK